MPLDEAKLRRPEFRGDIPLTLADSQTWFAPRPVLTFGMIFGEDGKPAFKRTDIGFGDGYIDVLQKFYDADGPDQMNALAEMACRVMKVNYDLDNSALATLLPYRPADPENVKLWAALVDVCTGNVDPKAAEPEDDTFD